MDNYVLCLCCDQIITRQREREHRKKRTAPDSTDFLGARPSRRSTKRRIFEPPEERIAEHHEGLMEDGSQPPNDDFLPETDHIEISTCAAGGSEYRDTPIPATDMHVDSAVSEEEQILLRHWRREGWPSKSDSESESDGVQEGDDIPFEDDEEVVDEMDAVDWDALEKECGLSAWDHLGGDYEAEAVDVAEKLLEYDRAICRAFAYKVTTHSTDKSYRKIPFAFRQDPPLPKIDALRSRVTFLSGFKPEFYHCCPNSCCCYVGPHADLTQCPYCKEPRYRSNGKTPRKVFTYIPLIPRLVAFAQNSKMATSMQYRSQHIHKEGNTENVFDGTHYQSLRNTHVEIDGKKLGHKYFSDPRDVAMGISTDGFAPFKRRKNTAWPIIAFNYNLPVDLMFLLEYILSLGVIPGPNKPKDPDSFLWPFLQEMLRLSSGVRAFDILTKELFLLHAYLILVFGDIPAVSMLMHMKGHNGKFPCRICKIQGLRVPGSRATTYYIPLDQKPHPDVHKDRARIQKYNPASLPLRSHDEFLAQAAEVDAATTNAEAERLAKAYGIKGTPLLSYLHSLSFPASFPYDFMHLIWENLLKNLVLHWTGEFKELDSGKESYQLSEAIWEGIGRATSASGSTIPSAYGSRVPNIATDKSNMSAEMWSFWTLYIGPVVLRNRFLHRKYYIHFIELVHLLTICLRFEITDAEIEELRTGFIKWVEEYENIYYQHDASRLSACPLTVHALLHIADSIKFNGPVWCYWAFPMERYCGTLQPAIRSRRFPYASMDRYVVESAQLTQLKVLYNMSEELALRPLRAGMPQGAFAVPEYPAIILLPPKGKQRPSDPGLVNAICAALVTRFEVPINLIRRHLKQAVIEEWGKFRRVDSEEGDMIRSSSLGRTAEDTRDATFVRYEVDVDIYAHRKRKSVFVTKTFYGQIERLLLIKFNDPDSLTDLRLCSPANIILAGIRSCKLEDNNDDLQRLDIHLYSQQGALDVIDVTCIKALVGRVKSEVTGGSWALIDRSGTLARGENDPDNDREV